MLYKLNPSQRPAGLVDDRATRYVYDLKFELAYSGYLRSHPTIKEVLEHHGLGDQRIMLKKNPGILNAKEYVTSEGIYIGEPFD